MAFYIYDKVTGGSNYLCNRGPHLESRIVIFDFLLLLWLIIVGPRELQLSGCQVWVTSQYWLPPGPVLHPHHPHRHRVLGQLLDGRGARAGQGGARRHHPPHHLQQVSRSQLGNAPSLVRQGKRLISIKTLILNRFKKAEFLPLINGSQSFEDNLSWNNFYLYIKAWKIFLQTYFPSLEIGFMQKCDWWFLYEKEDFHFKLKLNRFKY